MSYGYDAYTHNREQLSDMTIYDHAEALVAALAVERQKTDVRHITNSHSMLYFPPSCRRNDDLSSLWRTVSVE
jgi:hypothetical protein